MQSIKRRVVSILLAVMLAMTVFVVTPVKAFAVDIPVTTQGSLSAALLAASDFDTITLQNDINYSADILVTGKTITINLNNHNLDITAASSFGLRVTGNAKITILGPGTMTVTSNNSSYEAVMVDGSGSELALSGGAQLHVTGVNGGVLVNQGKATFSSVTINPTTAYAAAVRATDGSTVNVTGAVTAPTATATLANYGVWAEGNSFVDVGGTIKATTGITCSASRVTVWQNVESISTLDGCEGVQASNGLVQIKGNVLVATTGGNAHGVFSRGGGGVFIDGNVSVIAVGDNARGLLADGGGFILVGSNVTVEANGDDARGVYSMDEDNSIIVLGDVIVKGGNNAYGVYAWHISPGKSPASVVEIEGNVSVTGIDGTGVYTYGRESGGSATKVTVGKDVNVTGTGGIGVNADYYGQAIIDGTITAPTWIKVGTTGTVWLGDDIASVGPGITGPETFKLNEGYAATATGVYTLTSLIPVTVTLDTTHGDKIVWNSTTKKLDIAAGLVEGTYTVVLTASNGIQPDATLTFELTVEESLPPTGDANMLALAIATSALALGLVCVLAWRKRSRTVA